MPSGPATHQQQPKLSQPEPRLPQLPQQPHRSPNPKEEENTLLRLEPESKDRVEVIKGLQGLCCSCDSQACCWWPTEHYVSSHPPAAGYQASQSATQQATHKATQGPQPSKDPQVDPGDPSDDHQGMDKTRPKVIYGSTDIRYRSINQVLMGKPKGEGGGVRPKTKPQDPKKPKSTSKPPNNTRTPKAPRPANKGSLDRPIPLMTPGRLKAAQSTRTAAGATPRDSLKTTPLGSLGPRSCQPIITNIFGDL